MGELRHNRGPMFDEPRRHRMYCLAMVTAVLATVPFAFVGRAPASWLGLPLWLWSSFGATAVLSGLTAWGILRYWRDDDDA